MTQYTTRRDPTYGHEVLDPMPSAGEIEAFYRDTYYKLIDDGKRAIDIARTRKGGTEADDQARWMKETIYKDISDTLQTYAPGGNILEVGCGLGVLLDHLAEEGFKPHGLDLATAAVEAVRGKGYEAFAGPFDTLVENGTIAEGFYDGVVFVEVLEQTFDPVANMRAAARVLKPGGVVVIRSASDFSPLQLAAHERLGVPRWWISGPDHIHYFTYETMEAMLRDAGLEPLLRQSDFPMELFILMGLDYTADRAVGADCHKRRVMLERALPPETRRKLYRAFAEAGMGRCMLIAARKPA